MSSHISLEKIQDQMFEMIKQRPYMILSFKAKLVTDEMWEYAIARDASLFTECKRRTYHMAAIALGQDGFLLGELDPVEYTGEQYQSLCRIAVNQNPKAITMVPKEFRSDELVSYAYAKDPSLLLSEKKLSPEMVNAIIDHNPGLIRYVVDPTDDMMIHALEKDPRTVVYFATISDRVKEFLEERYPQLAAMYLHD